MRDPLYATSGLRYRSRWLLLLTLSVRCCYFDFFPLPRVDLDGFGVRQPRQAGLIGGFSVLHLGQIQLPGGGRILAITYILLASMVPRSKQRSVDTPQPYLLDAHRNTTAL